MGVSQNTIKHLTFFIWGLHTTIKEGAHKRGPSTLPTSAAANGGGAAAAPYTRRLRLKPNDPTLHPKPPSHLPPVVHQICCVGCWSVKKREMERVLLLL
ncbi:hypothetical protein Hanom_Chr04g00288041 [Helianthus anomalus]